MYKETFPEKLKKARMDAGYTQQQVEDETGIKRFNLSKYENGEREPNIETLAILAQFYNADVNWLLGVSLYPQQTGATKKLRSQA